MNQNPDYQDWHTYRFRAMGSKISLWLELAHKEVAQITLHQVELLFAAAEHRLTRFDPDSELSCLNAQPEQWVPVSAVMWQVVSQALCLADETDGLFDPTLLNAVEAAGYRCSFENIASAPVILGQLAPDQLRGRWQEVGMDSKQRAVWLPAGVRLDLGGIAKGYTAQQAVAFLQQWGPCLVDAGGDLTAGDAPFGWSGWPVGVASPGQDPGNETPTLFDLWLENRTLATSGVDYRRWQHNGQSVHHLLDPQTGQPAETDALTVTVLSPDATSAEAWATAALVAGVKTGCNYLVRQNLAGALVDLNGNLTLTPAMKQIAILAFPENKMPRC